MILFSMIEGWTLSLLIQIWQVLNHIFLFSKHYLFVLWVPYILGQISNATMRYITGQKEYLTRKVSWLSSTSTH
jgi:hypothetical protein